MFSTDAQALMEAAVDAIIVIDHRGRIQAVNDSACRIFGHRTAELLGANVSMLMPEPDRSAHDGYLANYLASGQARIIGIGRQVTARRKDGTPFAASLSVGRVPDSSPPRFVGLVRDITAEIEATNALELERDRSNAYLELNDAILLSIDAQRRVHEVNARGAELLGAARPEIVGRDWLSFMRDETECERARLMLASARASGVSREREFDAVDATGAPRRIYWRCIARRTAGDAPAGWLCSGEDVTERARREENSHLAQQRLTRVARLATMGELASGMAHEINQPLTAITTYARACERYLAMPQPDLAEVREAVREIGVEGLRAGTVIGRLRNLVRTDADGEPTPLEVNALIDELRATLDADARAHEARLRIALTQHLPRVRAHGAQLQQVVLNLVRNAFEALLDQPAVERAVELTTVRTVNGDIEVRVTDNGPGISTAIVDRLFDPFSTTKPAGTGLGLTISRTIVHAHGGTIGTRAVAPRGVTFYVQLPAAEDETA